MYNMNRITRKNRGFAVMAKPAGSLCNLRCRYCYYLDAPARTGDPSQTPGGAADAPEEKTALMDDETLELFVRQHFEGNPGPVVQFNWHGGEPTLAGLDFYRKAVELQKKYKPANVQCWNNIQTNGVLLTDEWCRFLAENHFDVGLSIDGIARVHDRYRRTAGDQDSFHYAKEACERLMKYGVKPDLLCTVTMDTVKNADAVYRGLKSLHTGWIQFIPILVREGFSEGENTAISRLEEGLTQPDASETPEEALKAPEERPETSLTPESVTPEAYGKFLCEIFDEWVCHDLGSVGVQLFMETLSQLSGRGSSLCMLQEECGRVLVLEHDGSVYSCDHFVDRKHYLGNIHESTLSALADSEAQERFGRAKKSLLPKKCLSCPYLKLCGGNCLKDRFSPDGSYYLCEGLRMFYEHAKRPLLTVLELNRKKVPAGTIMAQLRAEMKKQKRLK